MNYFDEDTGDDNPGQFWDNMADDIAEKPGQVPVNGNRISDEELAASLTDWDDKIARFNTVHLVGRVGNDPEPRYFDDGKVVVNLSLASRRKYHYLERKAREIQSGEEETDWYGLEIWGQTAEYVAKFVDKGARVGVVGSLQVDTWTDRATGEQREKAKVVVREFDLLETKAEADLRRNKGGGQSGPGRGSSSFYAGGSGSGSLGRDRFDEYNPSQGSSGGFFDS
jgi:single-strand DNA-binding protein